MQVDTDMLLFTHAKSSSARRFRVRNPEFRLARDLGEEDFAVLTGFDLIPDLVGNAELLPNGPAGVALPRRSAETPRALLHDINYRASGFASLGQQSGA
jgi:hypothetical protein